MAFVRAESCVVEDRGDIGEQGRGTQQVALQLVIVDHTLPIGLLAAQRYNGRSLNEAPFHSKSKYAAKHSQFPIDCAYLKPLRLPMSRVIVCCRAANFIELCRSYWLVLDEWPDASAKPQPR